LQKTNNYFFLILSILAGKRNKNTTRRGSGNRRFTVITRILRISGLAKQRRLGNLRKLGVFPQDPLPSAYQPAKLYENFGGTRI